MNVEEAMYGFDINNRSEVYCTRTWCLTESMNVKFINELKLNNTILNITLLEDNESSIKLMHNVKQHNCIKYIDVQHYIWNIINKKLIVKWVSTKKMLMNELMKILTKNTFKSHWKQLEVVWLNEVHMQKKVDQV
jgi:hypothetical protein